MNTYHKFYPNVFVAKCSQKYEKGDIIPVTTRYGKVNDSVVFNFLGQNGGFFFHSIVRADGFNIQEFARKKAERLLNASSRAESESNKYWEASHEGRDFLALAEPIKIGHHSEKRHRALIERNHNRMSKSVEFDKKAKELEYRAEYWQGKENDINLSMPESLEYYELKLEQAKERHEGLKNGTIEREHSFSLTYAKKAVNDLTAKFEMAKKLWA